MPSSRLCATCIYAFAATNSTHYKVSATESKCRDDEVALRAMALSGQRPVSGCLGPDCALL